MKKVILTAGLVLLFTVNVFGVTGRIIDNKTYVPVRDVFVEIGFDVSYDSTTGTAIISDENYNISIPKDKTYFIVNGKSIKPDTPQRIVDGSMYLPLRAVGDSIGAVTSWDKNTKTAKIEFNGNTSTVSTSATVNIQPNEESIIDYVATYDDGKVRFKLNAVAEKQLIDFVEDNIRNGYGGEESVYHATLDNPQETEFKDEHVTEAAEIIYGDFDFDTTKFAPGRKYYTYVSGEVIRQNPTGEKYQIPNSACVLFNITDNKLADIFLVYTIF